jgi:hypothetical protein
VAPAESWRSRRSVSGKASQNARLLRQGKAARRGVLLSARTCLCDSSTASVRYRSHAPVLSTIQTNQLSTTTQSIRLSANPTRTRSRRILSRTLSSGSTGIGGRFEVGYRQGESQGCPTTRTLSRVRLSNTTALVVVGSRMSSNSQKRVCTGVNVFVYVSCTLTIWNFVVVSFYSMPPMEELKNTTSAAFPSTLLPPHTYPAMAPYGYVPSPWGLAPFSAYGSYPTFSYPVPYPTYAYYPYGPSDMSDSVQRPKKIPQLSPVRLAKTSAPPPEQDSPRKLLKKSF